MWKQLNVEFFLTFAWIDLLFIEVRVKLNRNLCILVVWELLCMGITQAGMKYVS